MQIGFLGALTLLFIAAKLWEVVSWSWWIVLLPAYGPILFLIVFALAAYGGMQVMEKKWGKNETEEE